MIAARGPASPEKTTHVARQSGHSLRSGNRCVCVTQDPAGVDPMCLSLDALPFSPLPLELGVIPVDHSLPRVQKPCVFSWGGRAPATSGSCFPSTGSWATHQRLGQRGRELPGPSSGPFPICTCPQWGKDIVRKAQAWAQHTGSQQGPACGSRCVEASPLRELKTAPPPG